MNETLELIQAALFHISDLRESMYVTNAKGLTKAEMKKQLDVWDNSVSVAESLLEEALKQ